MKPDYRAVLDERQAQQIVRELLTRRPGYLREWQPGDRGSGVALLWIYARYLEVVYQRLNQSPDKNKLAFLDALGIPLTTARSSRAPVVFVLSEQAESDSRVPQGTRLVAAAPPDSGQQQIIFETEQTVGLAAGRLSQVYSLWPGRDQYIDHSPAHLSHQPFIPFRKPDLKNIPHTLYLAHDTLLAFAGRTVLELDVEVAQPSSEALRILWEYWDGAAWRGFRNVHPVCLELDEYPADGTDGLRCTGVIHLETDCAETAKTTINGIEAFWIRGILDETLPPLPERVLPELESIKLSAIITQPPDCMETETVQVTFDQLVPQASYGSSHGHSSGDVIFTQNGVPVSVNNYDDNGTPAFGTATVKAGDPQSMDLSEISLKFDFTKLGGTIESITVDHLPFESTVNIAVNDRLHVNLLDKIPREIVPGVTLDKVTGRLMFTGSVQTLLIGSGANMQIQRVTAQVKRAQGFAPDLAFADTAPLDVSSAFYPLGALPRPGNVFFFTNAELFSKPGAIANLYLRIAPTPEGQIGIQTDGATPSLQEPLAHNVIWEYWNGRAWIVFVPVALDNPAHQPDFTASGLFEFVIPDDMALLTINNEEARWMRVRLESGGYGFSAKVKWTDGRLGMNEFTYIVPQAPSVAEFKLCYVWQYGPFHPEHVLTHNDFQYQDETEAAIWPGQLFQPYTLVQDVTPALYLGFGRKLPVDRLSFFFDVLEEPDDTFGPPLLWEYWDGFNWRRVQVADETNELRVPGMVSLIGAADADSLARFGRSLYWLRARLKQDGPPGEPTLNAIFPNTAWASQQQTVVNEPIGVSNGRANQIFVFRQIPILPNEQIEIRELAGPRAQVEWRILAREVFGEQAAQLISEIEGLLSNEGLADVERGALRLKRDRAKRVTEVWVTWQGRQHLFASNPTDRHYTLERSQGLLTFGDGERAKIPPPSATIQARKYYTGGGKAGNLPAPTQLQIQGAVGALERVFFARSAEGGADSENLEMYKLRGPRTLRRAGRGVSEDDYVTMAKEATPAVAVARVLTGRDPAGIKRPGWVTLVIIPHSQDLRPWPSFGLRDQVRRYIEREAPAAVVAAEGIYITGPEYLPIDLEVTIAPLDPIEAGIVEQRTRQALEMFFHPLYGGPDHEGWEVGRDVFPSDVASIIEQVQGVDYAKGLTLFVDHRIQNGQVHVPEHLTICTGTIRLNVEMAEGRG